jgi:hypothetical protein
MSDYSLVSSRGCRCPYVLTSYLNFLLQRLIIVSKLYTKSATDYLEDVLRGTRQLNRQEGRSIAGTLRKHYNQLFDPPGMRDGLALSLLDGYRYRCSLIHREQPPAMTPAAAAAQELRSAAKARKLKEVYLVNKRKYHSLATEEELHRKLDKEEEDMEDIHRILQSRIRVRYVGCSVGEPCHFA